MLYLAAPSCSTIRSILSRPPGSVFALVGRKPQATHDRIIPSRSGPYPSSNGWLMKTRGASGIAADNLNTIGVVYQRVAQPDRLEPLGAATSELLSALGVELGAGLQ